MIKKMSLSLVLPLFLFVACQQKPTKSLEETVNAYGVETVLADTRNSFFFTLSHIPGSINLASEDFLILKNPKTKKRILDPDLEQTIEHLARKGLHPDRKIILLADSKDSVENKKWNWLLKSLGLGNIEVMSLAEFNKIHPNSRYANPSRAEIWDIKLSPELQQEFILSKAAECFVGWSEKKCKS